MKCGVVITTHGNNGIYARQCLECYLRNIPEAFIVFFVNTSEDEITLSVEKDYPQINYIYISDQKKNGGLTGTWNQGIQMCIENNCEIIILSNDDIFFDGSIKYIIEESESTKKTEMKYFGPITNNPGPTIQNKESQYGTIALDKEPYVCNYRGNHINLNGFFMVFPRHVLENNMFDNENYFDPSYPFGGNEVEWYQRFIKKKGIPIIVPKTFIYHYKLKNWRKNKELNDTCIFTINFGNYEDNEVYIQNNTDVDMIYLTDNSNMEKGGQIHKCIEKNVTFFYYDTKKIELNFEKQNAFENNDTWYPFSKLLQRIIKTNPSKYLPVHYTKTLYIDGDRVLTRKIFKRDIDQFLKNYDLVCFDNPWDRGNPKKVSVEMDVIVASRLEKKENVDKIREIIKINKFPDNIGLSETSILIRNNSKLLDFSKEWQEMIQICIRDQASFEYLLWKHQVNFKRFPIKERFTQKKGHRKPRNRFVNQNKPKKST